MLTEAGGAFVVADWWLRWVAGVGGWWRNQIGPSSYLTLDSPILPNSHLFALRDEKHI